jgi:hypothetical protein
VSFALITILLVAFTVSGQSAQRAALRVVDSTGSEVGVVGGAAVPGQIAGMGRPVKQSDTIVTRHIDSMGIWLGFLVNTSGFVEANHTVYFTSSDCTGPAYFDATDTLAQTVSSNGLQQYAFVVNGNVYFGSSISSLTVRSTDSLSGGSCSVFDSAGLSGNFALVQSFSVASLGLTPPFKLAR